MELLTESQRLKVEQDFVKSTYDNIAEDFSCTRYKKWPRVDGFLKSLPNSTLLLDIGCGNGKYLDNPTTINLGCDVSLNLLKICKSRGFEVVQCDMSRLPFRDASFDSVICIAALHHVVTSLRRQLCLERFMNLVVPKGQLLIQVWSYEQDIEQDNPYIKKSNGPKTNAEGASNEVSIDDQLKIPVHINRTQFKDQDLMVPFHMKSRLAPDKKDVQQLRYYHVFKRGELDSMFENIPNVVILDSYYDRGNWCSVAMKK